MTLHQILLARRLGKKRIIAETGAGQHGVATATVCARFGLECIVYMGAEDVRRQALNVFRMNMLGAKVRHFVLYFAISVDLHLGYTCRVRISYSEGCRQRSHARLGNQPFYHTLSCWLLHRSTPVPNDGARLPEGNRA